MWVEKTIYPSGRETSQSAGVKNKQSCWARLLIKRKTDVNINSVTHPLAETGRTAIPDLDVPDISFVKLIHEALVLC